MATPSSDIAHVPFSASLEPAFFFSGAGRGEVLQTLFTAVDGGDPVCLVTGGQGSGKSALVSELESRLEHVAEVLYLPQPQLPAMDLYRALAEQCGLRTGALDSDKAVERAVEQCLQERRLHGRRTVLVVEEAQAAASATLRSVHRMCHSGGADPWLQLLVFADTESDQTAQLPRVLTPVSHHLELAAPTIQDVGAYCNEHLERAGRGAVDDTVARTLCELSRGSFRRINVLAAAALEVADQDGSVTLADAHVQAAARQFGLMPATGMLSAVRARLRALPRPRMPSLPTVMAPASVPRAVRVSAVGVAASAVITAVIGSLLVDGSPENAGLPAVQAEAPAADAGTMREIERRVVVGDTASTDGAVPVRSDPTVVPVESVASRPADPADQTTGSGALGNPRIAVLGKAIGRLATHASAVGDGPFALRTRAGFDGDFTLVKRVNNAALRLGPAPDRAAAPGDTGDLGALSNPALALDAWFGQSGDWLARSAADRYSIQLLLVSRDSDKLEDFMATLPATLDRQTIRAFPTQRDGRALTLVVFGDYASADAARDAIAALPRSLRRLQPFVRSVGSLRGVVTSA
ncbi:MAG: AAA family ATPase [Pseudomonadota bacterium]